MTSQNSRMRFSAPSGRSWTTPPGRMNAWFIRSPVRNSSRCRTSSRSRKPLVMPVSAPSSMPPVARATRCEPIRLISMRSTRMTWARVGTSMPSSRSIDMQ